MDPVTSLEPPKYLNPRLCWRADIDDDDDDDDDDENDNKMTDNYVRRL